MYLTFSIIVYTLEWENYRSQAKSGLLPAFTNTVVLEHSMPIQFVSGCFLQVAIEQL